MVHVGLLQVADLIRRRKCSCPAEVVNTLLVLKLKDADPKAMTKGTNPSFSIGTCSRETLLTAVTDTYWVVDVAPNQKKR